MQAEDVITRAYRAVLGRDADLAGLAAYSQEVASGQLDAFDLVRLLLDSVEFKNRGGVDREDRSAVNALVERETNFVVQAGPFAGMKLLDRSNRGDGDVAPKLLGTYEQETHSAIEGFARNDYDAIIDVGCAEGYFAVGLARLFPRARVLAYDTDAVALDILVETAELNGCSDRIVRSDFCDPQELGRVLALYPRSLAVIDCEGYEKTLFSDPASNRAAVRADLIIECHDLWDATITPTIIDALGTSHDIEVIRASGRNPNVYDFLAHLSDWDRFQAVWERRGARQNWLVCRARQQT